MKKIVIVSLLFLFSTILFAADNSKGTTIEEDLIAKRMEAVKRYTYSAKMGDRAQKAAVLDEVLANYDKLGFSEDDKELVQMVSFLSEEGSIRQEYENNRLVNDYPDVRRKSVQVLAKIGGDTARDTLINILHTDQNPAVKAEACNALAKVKDNKDGKALGALVYVYRSTYRPDPSLIQAIITAVKQIASADASAYADAIYVLSEIQMGSHQRKIREEAYNAIQELSANPNRNKS